MLYYLQTVGFSRKLYTLCKSVSIASLILFPISSHTMEEGEGFKLGERGGQCSLIFLHTAPQHVDFLKTALLSARKEVTIISPQISIKAIQSHQISQAIQRAQTNGKRVIIYTDAKLGPST